MNMAMWTKYSPESLRTILEAYAELVNTPRIGTYNNYMWPTYQLNMAPPQRVSVGMSPRFIL